ncbi:MAG: two-component system sensor histidine kinase NtrB [Candidatus Polarisedimenticolia bacterium]
MIGRAVLLTALLGSGLIIGRLLGQPLLAADRFYLLTAAGFAGTIVYALLHPLWSRHPASTIVQVAGDILLITGFVQATGGIDSPFSLLYFLPVIAASIMLGRAGALSSATGAWMSYALLVVLIVYGWLDDVAAASRSSWATADTVAIDRRVAYSLFSHFVGFFTVAYLASYLSIKLRAAGDELQEKSEVLARVQTLNKNIIDSISSGIVTTDLEGGITFMNHGAEVITGRRLAQMEGASMETFLGREDGFLRSVLAHLETRPRHRFDLQMRTEGAAVFLGFTCAVLKDGSEQPQGYIFSFQDLTEIKALEEEVRLKDHMAALGQMAAGIAHEIRNPLASMSGSVQILKKSLQLAGEEGELLDIVLRESRRLDGIIRDFLLFARPGRFDPQPADLAPLLSESLTLLRNSEELGPNHAVETDFEPGGAFAMVDANMMKQVFWNLAKNAIKAMPSGGRLRVAARRDGASRILVSFTDTGMGMDDAQLKRAFEPFCGSFQQGTGLGLAVVFRIVQEHGGRIHVSSRVGQGTEVRLTLPASESATTARRAVVMGRAS